MARSETDEVRFRERPPFGVDLTSDVGNDARIGRAVLRRSKCACRAVATDVDHGFRGAPQNRWMVVDGVSMNNEERSR